MDMERDDCQTDQYVRYSMLTETKEEWNNLMDGLGGDKIVRRIGL